MKVSTGYYVYLSFQINYLASKSIYANSKEAKTIMLKAWLYIFDVEELVEAFPRGKTKTKFIYHFGSYTIFTSIPVFFYGYIERCMHWPPR